MLNELTPEQIQKGYESIAYNVSKKHPLVTILEDTQDAADCTDDQAALLWAQWKIENPVKAKLYSEDPSPSVPAPVKALPALGKFKSFLEAAKIPSGMKGLQDFANQIMPKTEEEAQALLDKFHQKHPGLSDAFEQYKKETNASFDEKLDAPVGGLTESSGLDFQLKNPTEAQTAAMAKEEAKDEKFDLSKFIPDMEMKETVKSSSSENVYALVASHGSSKVGVSVTLTPKPVSAKEIHLHLLCRFLEVPLDGVSAFPNPGETRVYLKDGEPCEVFMLAKFNWKLCNAQCSPWEVRSHLEAGVKDQVTAFVWRMLEERGCAINCTDLQDLQNVLFVRLDQLPDSPALYWENLGDDTPGSL